MKWMDTNGKFFAYLKLSLKPKIIVLQYFKVFYF